MLISLGLKQDVHILINFFPHSSVVFRGAVTFMATRCHRWGLSDVRFGWKLFHCLFSYEKHVSGSWQAEGSWFKLPAATSSLKLWEIKMIFLLALCRRELFCVRLCQPQVPFHHSSWQISDFYSWSINANIDAGCSFAEHVSNPESSQGLLLEKNDSSRNEELVFPYLHLSSDLKC